MDLRGYYKRIREMESRLTEPHVLLISRETTDGGKAGVRTEASRLLAARLIVEERARLATSEEKESFLQETLEAKRLADQVAAASRMQVVVVPANGKPLGKNPKEQL